MMKKQQLVDGSIRTDWVIVCFVLVLLTALLLKTVNLWIDSEVLARFADIVGLIPLAAIFLLIVLFLVLRRYTDRRVATELKKLNEENSQGTEP